MSSRSRIFAFALLAFALIAADKPPRSLELYFVDVMGGAATLIVTPERESMLIDSGWAGFDDRDPKRIEHVIKNVAGLERLDHLVTTHWHADHFGGVDGLLKRLPIGHFWDRGLPDPTAADGDRTNYPDGPRADDPLGVAYRNASEGRRIALAAGDTIPLKGAIQTLVLASGGKGIETPGGPPNPLCADAPPDLRVDPSDNARSLAIRFRLGRFDFLDCGDLTWNVEKTLVCPTDKIGPIDLYQVTHHGMAISNHPTLVRTIAPRVAIMNNGPKKGGDAAAVKLLKSVASIEALYQLHKNVATSVEENTDPDLIANHDPAGGEFIRVRVSPDGTSYTVAIGADGKERRFESR
jgi:competence protein ComEC